MADRSTSHRGSGAGAGSSPLVATRGGGRPHPRWARGCLEDRIAMYERRPQRYGTHHAYCPRIAVPASSMECAMRSFHSAGPVVWTLVPCVSTATVTGMSTTSNS